MYSCHWLVTHAEYNIHHNGVWGDKRRNHHHVWFHYLQSLFLAWITYSNLTFRLNGKYECGRLTTINLTIVSYADYFRSFSFLFHFFILLAFCFDCNVYISGIDITFMFLLLFDSNSLNYLSLSGCRREKVSCKLHVIFTWYEFKIKINFMRSIWHLIKMKPWPNAVLQKLNNNHYYLRQLQTFI